MDAVFKRRSVRQYLDQDVDEALLKKILGAGMSAPSAGNEEPWHFIVIEDKKLLNDVGGCSPYAKSAALAPVVIVVCGDLALERHKGYWVQDCSAAVENMLIEATALGLGAVWLGVHPVEDRVKYMKTLLDLPENIVPFAIIPIGYPSHEPKESDRYREERVHHGHW
jgi:nitroreductase